MDVGVGYSSDPVGLEGLAHFLGILLISFSFHFITVHHGWVYARLRFNESDQVLVSMLKFAMSKSTIALFNTNILRCAQLCPELNKPNRAELLINIPEHRDVGGRKIFETSVREKY